MFYLSGMIIGGTIVTGVCMCLVAAVRARRRPRYKSFMRAFKEELMAL